MSAILENAVGGLIASEVHGLIGMVLSRINAEIKLAWGYDKELEDLQRQLTRLAWVLQGASSHPITNPLMADWLRKINDAAYDVDDLLDEWSYEALKVRITKTKKRDMFMLGVSKPFCRLRKGHKARDLTNLISNIYSDANKLGIKPIRVAAGEVYSTKHSHQIEERETRLRNQRHFVDEKLLIGRDEDLKKLVKLLCHPNNNSSDLNVIGIVGMAGLGKTTLCKRISKVEEVTQFFNSMIIWLVISRTFNLLDVLKRMVEILFGEISYMTDRQALISKLSEMKLKGKKYLLILDDVWDTIQWESLKTTLEDIGGSNGTTMLVTSRNKDTVENLVINCYNDEGKHTLKRPSIYTLQELSVGHSWSLFMARVGDDNLVGSEKELIAKRMMKHCRGVPLAIRALGDLLRDKSIGRWKEIEKSNSWTNVDSNDILPSLRLSYDYLPHSTLKKCFAYCAIFEEDEVIEKHKLIYMWIAQGFLYAYEEMENKGEEYIEHLLNSSLFQEAKMDECGNLKTFKMHDLVWSLAQVVSKGECLCLDQDERTNDVQQLLVSRLSRSTRELSQLTLTSFTKLRTCFLYKAFWFEELPNLKFLLECRHLSKLRVLSVRYSLWKNIEVDWKPLGSLKHLRYFKISLQHSLDFMLSNLGEHITKLYHLQTLCIDNRLSIKGDPCNIRYPKEIGNLVKLRHILDNNSDDIGIPMGLGHLTALQTLPAIDLGVNWGGRVSELGFLTNLRGKLVINNLCYLKGEEEARDLILDNKSHLERLDLFWGSYNEPGEKENSHVNEILEALQPNANLKMLSMWGPLTGYKGTRFPRWLLMGGSSLSNLVSLNIFGFKEADGNLNLYFRSLRFLNVQSCYKLSITLPKEEFQSCKSLEKMVVTSCYNVEILGDLSLLTQLRSLTIMKNQVAIGSSNTTLPRLRELETDELELVAHLSEDSLVCKSLEKLTLNNTTLPDQLQHLRVVQYLAIEHSSSLETMPEWLGSLTSLGKLYLDDLPRLKNLPSQEAMLNLSNLKTIQMQGCPHLLEDFNKKTGEWLKVAHIYQESCM